MSVTIPQSTHCLEARYCHVSDKVEAYRSSGWTTLRATWFCQVNRSSKRPSFLGGVHLLLPPRDNFLFFDSLIVFGSSFSGKLSNKKLKKVIIRKLVLLQN